MPYKADLPVGRRRPAPPLVNAKFIVPMAGESAGQAGVIDSGCVAIYPWLGGFARVTGRFREVCEPKILTLNGGRKLGSSVYGLYNAALDCTREVIRRLKGATCWMRWSTSTVVVSEIILGGENGESQWCYVHGTCRRGWRGAAALFE